MEYTESSADFALNVSEHISQPRGNRNYNLAVEGCGKVPTTDDEAIYESVGESETTDGDTNVLEITRLDVQQRVERIWRIYT